MTAVETDVAREFLRLQHADAIETLAGPVEDAFVEAVRRVLLRALAAAIPGLTASAEPVDLGALGGIESGWAAEVPDLAAVIAQMYETGALAAMLEHGPGGAPATLAEVVPEGASDALRQASNRLARTSDALWAQARSSLAEGVANGEDLDALQKRVENALGHAESRARTVARTEVVGALNAGSVAGVKALGAFGPRRKEWLATHDRRTRDTHYVADGQKRPVNIPFTVGGEALQYPGDPNGSAAETVNCRCTLVFTETGTERAPGSAPPPRRPRQADQNDEIVQDESLWKETDAPKVHDLSGKYDTQKSIQEIDIKPGQPVLVTNIPDSSSIARIPYAAAERSGPTNIIRQVTKEQYDALSKMTTKELGEWMKEDHLALTARRGVKEIGDLVDAEKAARMRSIVMSLDANPADSYWAVRYNDPGFKSAATGGANNVTVYNGNQVTTSTVRHEFGHLMDRKYADAPAAGDFSTVKRWHDAQASDAALQQGTTYGRIDWMDGGHAVTLGSEGITTYGQVRDVEDFAESVRLYLYDRKYGKVGRYTATMEPVRFADIWPNRARILDGIL